MLEAESENAVSARLRLFPPRVAVPASLHASLMSRLDRLGSAKEIAQIGAAIGREFSYPLLAAVRQKPEAEFNRRSTVSSKPVWYSYLLPRVHGSERATR